MKKIGITGSKGVIGQILTKHLKDTYQLMPLSRPDIDVTHLSKLREKTKGLDVLIHLAQVRGVSWKNDNFDAGDFSMTYNAYKVCIENKIPRVIMASSIHANDYLLKSGKSLKTVETLPTPDSQYGAYKVYMEALGRYYAKRDLEVICLRFGGVNPENKTFQSDEENYDRVYLSHYDLVSLIKTCIEIEKVPNNYELLYAVSNNKRKVHDWKNNLGWIPKDSASPTKYDKP